MQLIIPQTDYFTEVGEIVCAVEKIKALGMDVYFGKEGIRISETYGKGAKDPFYQRASELRSYLNGLEDGFWHAIRVNQVLFKDIE